MRGMITRLSRLESKRSLKGYPSFYVFGLDEDDAAERMAAETRAGTIQLGDRCHMIVWTGTEPLPRPRWLTPRQMSDEELNAAIGHLCGAVGREPLPPDADHNAFTAEITALRQQSGLEDELQQRNAT